MRAFYRAAVDESARPTGRALLSLTYSGQLLHQLREDDDEARHGYRPGRGTQPDDPGDVDHRLRTAAAMVRRFPPGLAAPAASREQIADAERDVLAGECRKIEIEAHHLLRPIGSLESERKSHAELGAGDRQVGPRDLGLSRSLDRAAAVVLGLPVGARGGLNGFEARVLRVRVALGVDVRTDLQSVAADEIAALGAGEFEQALHGRLEFRAQGNVLHRILERGQVGHEPGVLALLAFGDIRTVTCDQPGERLAAR